MVKIKGLNRKKMLLIGLGCLISAVTLWFFTESSMADREQDLDSSQDLNQELLSNSLEDKTLKEEFRERAQADGTLNIAVSGSSVAEGAGATTYERTWVSLLENELNNTPDFPEVEMNNYSVSGFKVSDLLLEGVVANMMNANPDIIIFETSVINSYFDNESFEDTKASINQVVTMVEQELPNTLLVWISPNPIDESTFSSLINQNEYEDYVSQTREYIVDSGWIHFDSYLAWQRELDERGQSPDDYLSDGVHPNDEGYRLWFDLLYRHLIQA